MGTYMSSNDHYYYTLTIIFMSSMVFIRHEYSNIIIINNLYMFVVDK